MSLINWLDSFITGDPYADDQRNDGPFQWLTSSRLDQQMWQGHTVRVRWSGYGNEGVRIQWFRGGMPIPGATSQTYTFTQDDVGRRDIIAQVSRVDGSYIGRTHMDIRYPIRNANDEPEGTLSIEGELRPGETLLAVSTITDEDGLGTLNYQWQRSGRDIEGATGTTYSLTNEDLDHELTVVVTYKDGFGRNERVVSTPTSRIKTLSGEAVFAGESDGGAKQGDVLTVNTTDIIDRHGLIESTLQYQWRRDGVDIEGAAGSTYELTQNDVNAVISVNVRYEDRYGVIEEQTINTELVANVNDPGHGHVTILEIDDERAGIGTVLRAVADFSDPDGTFEENPHSFLWLRNGAGIPGATQSSYTLTEADVGSSISVNVLYIDKHHTLETITSSDVIEYVHPDNIYMTNTLVVSGEQRIGSTLTIDGAGALDHETVAPEGWQHTYQWRADGVDIEGATGSSYTLTNNEVNKRITVAVHYGPSDNANRELLITETTGSIDGNQAPGLNSAQELYAPDIAAGEAPPDGIGDGFLVRDIYFPDYEIWRGNEHARDATMDEWFSDADGDAPGIAVFGIFNPYGTYYYSLDNGENWQQIDPSTNWSNALLLRGDDQTRLAFAASDPTRTGRLDWALLVKTWDQTTGENGDIVSVPFHAEGADRYASYGSFSGAYTAVNLVINPEVETSAQGAETPSGTEGAEGGRVSALITSEPLNT